LRYSRSIGIPNADIVASATVAPIDPVVFVGRKGLLSTPIESPEYLGEQRIELPIPRRKIAISAYLQLVGVPGFAAWNTASNIL